MPKMSHAIEGWSHQSIPHPPVRRTAPARPHLPSGLPDQPGLWRYQSLTRSSGIVVLSGLVSIGLHAFALLGMNGKAPPPRRTLVDDGPLIQMVMPDLKDDEEEPVETLEDVEASEAPAISVPMLTDVPTIVPLNAFVQPLDLTPSLSVNPDSMRLSAIPVNIARGSASAAKLGKIFDISQLDRQPQALFQPAPVFPYELKSLYAEAEVTVEFIINTKGEVLLPRIITSPHRRFEDAVITGLQKWKFKPGQRGGRPVNTRTQITILFRVTKDE